ncbi:hypothetical protein CIB48_g9459 [Xylaria polymorpha]|nr:hypothetical protein CIB48_g9459 [Xylaria polymorpha]
MVHDNLDVINPKLLIGIQVIPNEYGTLPSYSRIIMIIGIHTTARTSCITLHMAGFVKQAGGTVALFRLHPSTRRWREDIDNVQCAYHLPGHIYPDHVSAFGFGELDSHFDDFKHCQDSSSQQHRGNYSKAKIPPCCNEEWEFNDSDTYSASRSTTAYRNELLYSSETLAYHEGVSTVARGNEVGGDQALALALTWTITAYLPTARLAYVLPHMHSNSAQLGSARRTYLAGAIQRGVDHLSATCVHAVDRYLAGAYISTVAFLGADLCRWKAVEPVTSLTLSRSSLARGLNGWASVSTDFFMPNPGPPSLRTAAQRATTINPINPLTQCLPSCCWVLGPRSSRRSSPWSLVPNESARTRLRTNALMLWTLAIGQNTGLTTKVFASVSVNELTAALLSRRPVNVGDVPSPRLLTESCTASLSRMPPSHGGKTLLDHRDIKWPIPT